MNGLTAGKEELRSFFEHGMITKCFYINRMENLTDIEKEKL